LLDNIELIGYILAVIQRPRSRAADVVLRSGRIHAEVDSRPDGTAIAVADGRVVAVGSDADVADLIGPATDVRDLGGRAVLPGLTDSHTHLHRAALVRRLYLDFTDLAPATIGDVLDHVARRAGELPPDAWIQGDSLTASGLAEGRFPDRHELDRAGSGRPVVLRGIGKHVIAASSAALRAAGIDATIPDPPGGRIDRDESGEPTGILHERAKLRLDSSDPATAVPAPSRDERLDALRAVFADVHRLGITGIHEMIRLPDEADDLASLHAAGELPLRVRLWYRIHEGPIRPEHLVSLGIRRGLGDDWLRVLGVKVSVDGWCIFRNAAVYEPYLGEPENRGLLRIEPDELARLTVAANARGLGVAVHAVGPRAVDAALAAFEAAGPATAGPYRLEHGHLDMDERRLLRMRELQVAWSVQPGFLPAYRADWEQGLEPSRVDAILPLATAARLGIPVLHNSDVPSGPQDPIAAVRAAVTRRAGNRAIGPDQAVSATLAWRGWTTIPAWSAGERCLGALRPGYSADMIVISGDPFAVTLDDTATPLVVATMIEGRFVHGEDGVWA
jgi:predicted amidohydrolase YtcJ